MELNKASTPKTVSRENYLSIFGFIFKRRKLEIKSRLKLSFKIKARALMSFRVGRKKESPWEI